MTVFWPKLQLLGQERDDQKRGYQSTKNWSTTSTHFLGLVAEMVFMLETGIPFDRRLLVAGDEGYDFKKHELTIDIKGTQYYDDPHLKQYPNPKTWSDYYFLCGISVSDKKARLSGWTTKERLQVAPMHDYGYGPQRSLGGKDLESGLPSFLPSMRDKYKLDVKQK
jgi:hypothetical protein